MFTTSARTLSFIIQHVLFVFAILDDGRGASPSLLCQSCSVSYYRIDRTITGTWYVSTSLYLYLTTTFQTLRYVHFPSVSSTCHLIAVARANFMCELFPCNVKALLAGDATQDYPQSANVPRCMFSPDLESINASMVYAVNLRVLVQPRFFCLLIKKSSCTQPFQYISHRKESKGNY